MNVSWITPMIGSQVIADLDADYLVLGTLVHADEHHLELRDADVHDHGEANCTKEVYALESLKLGVRANRQRVVVPMRRLVTLSRLDELTR